MIQEEYSGGEYRGVQGEYSGGILRGDAGGILRGNIGGYSGGDTGSIRVGVQGGNTGWGNPPEYSPWRSIRLCLTMCKSFIMSAKVSVKPHAKKPRVLEFVLPSSN